MKETRKIKAVLFDFDGTLVKLNVDFPAMREAVLDLIVSYNVQSDGIGNLFALEMIEAGRELISRLGRNRESEYLAMAYGIVRRFEMEGAKEGVLIEGVKEMLAETKRRGIKAGVVTRNCRDAVGAIFPDIVEYCGAVITREDTERVKPHPDHLRTALRALKTSAPGAIMVGDHPMDIRAGRSIGAFTVGVLTGYSEKEDLVRAGADLVISSAAALVSRFDESGISTTCQ
ncbi:MAG TPA: HAD family hydrolase [Syntrophales bacterium]|nr:HAD family hydrolase [Syntrophales bacterium]